MAKILAVGGGSGGHVTPVVAVCKELRSSGEHELRFWCDRKFGAMLKVVELGFLNRLAGALFGVLKAAVIVGSLCGGQPAAAQRGGSG